MQSRPILIFQTGRPALLVMVLLSMLLLTTVSFAKDFSIPSAEVTYILRSDGTVNVTEEITYVLDGSFT